MLAQLIRIQHLSDRIAQLQSKDRIDENLPGIPRAPFSAYINAFQAELDKFKEQIPRHLRSNSKSTDLSAPEVRGTVCWRWPYLTGMDSLTVRTELLMNHFNTAMLKLWEPPIVDAKLLDSLSESFTSMSLGAPSTLDTFYRSNAALKAWFEFWLSIDITDYFYLPMPSCAQLLVAVTLLSRWAKLAGADPYNAPLGTSGNTNAKAASQGLADPSAYESASSSTPESKYPDAEPAVASAIARLKTQIRSQPALQLDVLGILRALVARFEQARSEVSEVHGGVWENNIWDLAAKKISITKIKLERWAEIVSVVGVEGLISRKYLPGDGSIKEGSRSSSETSEPAPMDGVENSQTMEFSQPSVQDGWQYNNNNFAHDLFDGLGLDQNFFYDDSGDYGTAILNNLSYSGFTHQGPIP